MSVLRPEIVVDLDAVRHNVRLLRELAGVPLIAVVKADGYGHGMVPVARAARQAGAEWLAVATTDEARALRAAGDDGPLLCWLTTPGEPLADLVAIGVDLSAYSVAELDQIDTAVVEAVRPARVQLKVDTGLSRGGAARAEWSELFARAHRGEAEGRWTVTGLWSHLACADEPDHPANDAQQAAFEDAVALAEAAGLRPRLRHLANSAAAITRPQARFDAVRCGIACYGLDPAPDVDHGVPLRPAMTVHAPLTLVKHLDVGDAVGYGHTHAVEAPTTVGLVPTGYGEGVPRSAVPGAEAVVDGKRRRLVGRVSMDQVMVDLGGDVPPVGSEVVLFGPPGGGRPTALDWARACGTINYEIVTRIGGRMSRRYTGTVPGLSEGEEQP